MKMNKTKNSKITKQSHHSVDYLNIRTNAEQNWPAWKIAAFNSNFAVSTHASKIIPVNLKIKNKVQLERNIIKIINRALTRGGCLAFARK